MTPRAIPLASPNALSERNFLRLSLCVAIIGAMLSVSANSAFAQRYIGKDRTPSVTVDLSVLDELGSAPNVPQLFLQNPTGSAYRNNPYLTQPKFPTIPKSRGRSRTNRLVLTPPSAKPQRIQRTRRAPVRRAAPRANPQTRNRIATRPPVRPPVRQTTRRPPAVQAPRTFAPPPKPTIVRPPAAVVAPPPKKIVTPPKTKPNTRIAAPSVRTIPVPPKAPKPPPLPPAVTVPKPKPKQIVRREVVKPPPLPPPAVIPPPPPTRKTARTVAVETPRAKPVRATPAPSRSPIQRSRPKPKQVAALPSSTSSVRSGSLRRIAFPPGSAKLSSKATLGIQNVAAALSADPGLRIQLLAYAGKTSDSASQARRLSLSRALAARSKLIEQGVRSTRIDVRALGNKSAGGPADRIDIIVTKR